MVLENGRKTWYIVAVVVGHHQRLHHTVWKNWNIYPSIYVPTLFQYTEEHLEHDATAVDNATASRHMIFGFIVVARFPSVKYW